MTSFGATTPITSRSLNTAFLQLESLIASPNANSLSGTTLASNVVNSSLTSVGTLTSLTIDGPLSPSVFFGDWNQNNNWSGIRGTFGYLLTGSSGGLDTGVYLRSESATHPIRIGANNTNTLTVTNTSATVAGTMNATAFVGPLTGNASTATNLSTDRTNWGTNGTISAVVGQLAWKNYGNSHTIFDASQSTSPNGGAVNNTNAAIPWSGTYPTLMGWNGSNTYGVRVDSARIADIASSVGTLSSLSVSGALNAYSISGNANVAGTGNASYHPSGVYSTGTNWLYGQVYTNGNAIGSTSQYCGAIYSNNWFRSSGTTGWYSEAYAAGIYSKATKEVWTYNASRFIASNNSSGANYSSQQLEVRSNDLFSGGSVAGISFHVYGANAPVLRYWTGTGAGLDVGNEGGTAYWYMGANNFVTRSSMRWKTDIRRRPQEQIVEVGLRLLEGETAIWDSKDIEPIFDEENECYVQPSAEQRELVKDDWIQRRHFNKRGYIVEELEKVFPEAVHYESDGKPSGVDYGVITTELVDILKLVVLQNDDQQRRIELLEKKRK